MVVLLLLAMAAVGSVGAGGETSRSWTSWRRFPLAGICGGGRREARSAAVQCVTRSPGA